LLLQERPRYGRCVEHPEVLRRLEREIELHGSLRRAATFLHISPQYLSAVLAGERAIGPKLLRPLKLRRKIVKVVTYEATRK
jgi:AraC-like DNA-binding protein